HECMGCKLQVESGKCSSMAYRRGVVLIRGRAVRKLEAFSIYCAGGSGAHRILETIPLHGPVKVQER
ncbi:MAG: hypothetical protein WCO86_18655, partial [Planctomycetota bacterium]